MSAKTSAWLFLIMLLAPSVGAAEERTVEANAGEVRLHLESSLAGKHRAVPAVVWLEAQQGTPSPMFASRGHYTLVQKNRTFLPHLQVIPVGSVVQFPNQDPFFHNVFSLFDGKKFNLGLYEAGTSRNVTFSRRGVSYIFCNIHPEMSAIILALDTPLYAIADEQEGFVIRKAPAGDYTLHVWIEGVPQSSLDGLTRAIHVTGRNVDLGSIRAPIPPATETKHSNMYGQTYSDEDKSLY